jgi:hypothetical protein
MGYRCPVCGAEEADAVHLANHLAVTASLGRRDHERWLDDYAPDWGEYGPDELADIVAEHATEIDTPEFDERGHDHERGRPAGLETGLTQHRQSNRGTMTAETEEVLREARELTRRMESTDEPAGSEVDETGANDSKPSAGDDGNENE